jgi:glucose-6-phosphate isomerase
MIKFDFNTYKSLNDDDIKKYAINDDKFNEYLNKYSNYLGWYNPNPINDELVNDIIKTAEYVKANCDVFIVIGIGGSYMGSKAVIEALSPYLRHSEPEIIFLGNSLSNEYIKEVINYIKNKDVIINYISKSGNTLETSITLKIMMDIMQEKYSKEEILKRVIYTVGKLNSVDSYKTFNIPTDVGGRYSVFTAVGLLPIAVAGLDIDEFIEGAKNAFNNKTDQRTYAITRHIMENKNILVEAYTIYEPKLSSFIEWLKQLYAESLGKNNKGILPIGVINPRDLHSLGQYLQDGRKFIFETVFNIEYNDKDLSSINKVISKSVSIAHHDAGIVNNIINIDELNEYNLGYLMHYFMSSCLISGYLMDINPFDQPGVEKYKNIIKDSIKKE